MSKFVNSTGHTVSWTQHFSLPAIVAQSAFSSAAWMMGSEGQSQPVTSYTSSAHHCNNICFSIICSALPFHKPFHLRVTSITGTVCPAPWAVPAATHIQVQGRNILHGKISFSVVSSADGAGVGVSHQNHLKSILSHNIVCTVHQIFWTLERKHNNCPCLLSLRIISKLKPEVQQPQWTFNINSVFAASSPNSDREQSRHCTGDCVRVQFSPVYSAQFSSN